MTRKEKKSPTNEAACEFVSLYEYKGEFFNTIEEFDAAVAADEEALREKWNAECWAAVRE